MAKFDTWTKLNRDFVLVNHTLWFHYHEERKRIYRDYLGGGMSLESFDAFPIMRGAHEALRAQIRALAPNYPPTESGHYLIPV